MKLKLNKGWESGFTIIETVIVLTITAFTVVIAISQLSGRSDQVRYGDSVAQLESYINQQFSEISQGADLSGVEGADNDCGDDRVPGDNECVFAGKVLEFTINSSTVVVHTMLGGLYVEDLANPGEKELADTLFESQPRSVLETNDKLDWQLEYIGARSAVGGSSDLNNTFYLGFFRVPSTTEVLPVVFNDGKSTGIDDVINQVNSYNPGPSANENSTIDEQFYAELCFSGISGDEARVTLGEEFRNNALSVKADFEEGGCLAP